MAYTIDKNTEYINYEVQDGDTYASIAAANGISLNELVQLNDLSPFELQTIYTGSVLKIGLRDITTGNVIKTGIGTDDEIEDTFFNASLQSVSVDTVTQAKLDAIKEKYREYGTLDSITNDLIFLSSEKGYTVEEVKFLLNEANIDLSGIDDDLIDKTLEKTEKRESVSTTYDDSDYSKDTILGLPFRYNTYSDPRRRVYNSTFMMDAPIVSIIPGKPLFRSSTENDEDGLYNSVIKALFGSNNNDDEILNNTDSTFFGSDDDILNWLKANQKNNENNGDLRYYRFKEDYDTFERYLDLNVSTLAVKMGVGSLSAARYTHFMGTPQNSEAFAGISRAFKFYCTKSGTSTNESISNEFGDSQLASTMNSVSESMQELKYLLGQSSNDEGIISQGSTKLIDSLTEVGGSLVETLTGKNNFDSSLGQFNAAAKAAVAGNKLIWPQIWKNSTFSRSYTLSFEFVSPYGSPEAIFRYVYLPFLVLLTLATPKQYGVSGYSNPFLIRLEMPGKFTSDLAVIQNMSWRKGGNDNLFTNEGLPLSITVDVTVQDLYPNMMMSETWAQLRHNTGMHSFLDNMAGLSVERFDPWSNIKASLFVKGTNILGELKRDTVGAFKTKLYSITTENPWFGNALNQ